MAVAPGAILTVADNLLTFQFLSTALHTYDLLLRLLLGIRELVEQDPGRQGRDREEEEESHCRAKSSKIPWSIGRGPQERPTA